MLPWSDIAYLATLKPHMNILLPVLFNKCNVIKNIDDNRGGVTH